MKLKLILALPLVVLSLMLPSCATTKPVQPAVEVRYQEVVREVKRPCPVKRPVKPAPLARLLPLEDPSALIDLLTSKLEEWAGAGKYGDQAEAAIATCTAP